MAFLTLYMLPIVNVSQEATFYFCGIETQGVRPGPLEAHTVHINGVLCKQSVITNDPYSALQSLK